MTSSGLLLALLLGSALSGPAPREELHHGPYIDDVNGLAPSQVGETPVQVTGDAGRAPPGIAPSTDKIGGETLLKNTAVDKNAAVPKAGASSVEDVAVKQGPIDTKSSMHTVSNEKVATAEVSLPVMQEPSDTTSTIHTVSNEKVAAAEVSLPVMQSPSDTTSTVHTVSNGKVPPAEVSRVAVMQEPIEMKSTVEGVPNEDVPTAGVSSDTESTVHIVSNEKAGTAEVSHVVSDTKSTMPVVPLENFPVAGLSTDNRKPIINALSNDKMKTAEVSPIVAVPEPSDTKSTIHMVSNENVATSGVSPVAVLLESSDTKSTVHAELKEEIPPVEVLPVAAMPEPIDSKSTVLTSSVLGPQSVVGESSTNDDAGKSEQPAPFISQSSENHSIAGTPSQVLLVDSSDMKLTIETVPSSDKKSTMETPSQITPESSEKKSTLLTPAKVEPHSTDKQSTLVIPESGEKIMEVSVPLVVPASEEKTKDETKKLPVTLSYKGAQVLRLRGVTSKFKKMVADMEENGDLERWNVNVTSLDVMIPKGKVEKIKRTFKKESLSYEIVIADIQEAIDTENPQLSDDDMAELTGRKGHNMTWQMYHRMNDMHGYLDYLAATYPNMVTVESIGYSHERKPLKVVRIASGNPNAKKLWIDGGIHAREWISPAAVSYIISELVENYEAHRSAVQNIDFYILPMANPDGYEYAHTYDRLWRKNRSQGYYCQGTDLNRNWGFHWGGPGSSRQPCKEIYAGKSAFSEPETQAISNYINDNKENMKAFVTFHSYGQYILYPWGYDRKLPADHQEMDRVGRVMAQAISSAGGPAYTVGSTAYVLYAASGGSDDWAKAVPKIKYSYTIELRDTGRYGFLLPSQFIKPVAKEALAAIKALASTIQSTP